MKVSLLSLLLFLLISTVSLPPLRAGTVVNDVTRINPIVVDQVTKPHSIEEIQEVVKNHPGPISIGGGHFSMGGQTATEGSLHLDLREFDKVINFSPEKKTITVQSGITWRKIQDVIDSSNLSLKIMQSYSNFTVGGSLSVNVHGRYIGQGPLIKSVRSIKAVLADGSLVEASPTKNSDLFYGLIGGYGGLGVIVEATLDLADNKRMERQVVRLPVDKYKDYFFSQIRNDPKAIFHNGDLYPPNYETVSAVSWLETEKPATEASRLIHFTQNTWMDRAFIDFISEFPHGKEIRAQILDPLLYLSKPVIWRNYEASHDVGELEPDSRKDSTYVLQEYFVPVENFNAFVPKMREIFQRHQVNVLNVSIRHSFADPGSLLAWAKGETFSFVVYYKQGVKEEDRKEVGNWTRELIDAALSMGGSYYLPYQIHATEAQFREAYPRAEEFFALKRKLDPTNKFRNKLWDRYFPASLDEIKKGLQAREGYRRPEEQTFLTLPEWYIVFSYDELGAFLKDHSPSDFPYYQSIGEFWSIYWKVYQITKNQYPVNWGYHLMVAVIGTSFTVEYGVKAIYEDTVGRFTHWLSSSRPTPEDLFIQKVSQEYGAFTHDHPWYEFPFFKRLKDFWKQTPLWGHDLLRKWERKIFFTHEFVAKTIYGWLINKGTQGAYGPEDSEIYVWAKVSPANLSDPRIHIVQIFGDQSVLFKIPRYEPFREILTSLSKQGAEFLEIAGNQNILLTVLVRRDSVPTFGPAQTLFESKVVTYPEVKRVALKVPASSLSQVLNSLGTLPVAAEHLFDY
jgi:FAD/FMN-containing dehydrogenase